MWQRLRTQETTDFRLMRWCPTGPNRKFLWKSKAKSQNIESKAFGCKALTQSLESLEPLKLLPIESIYTYIHIHIIYIYIYIYIYYNICFSFEFWTKASSATLRSEILLLNPAPGLRSQRASAEWLWCCPTAEIRWILNSVSDQHGASIYLVSKLSSRHILWLSHLLSYGCHVTICDHIVTICSCRFTQRHQPHTTVTTDHWHDHHAWAWRTLRTPGMGVVPLAMHQAMATCDSVVSGPCCCATSFMASSSPGHAASFLRWNKWNRWNKNQQTELLSFCKVMLQCKVMWSYYAMICYAQR